MREKIKKDFTHPVELCLRVLTVAHVTEEIDEIASPQPNHFYSRYKFSYY